MTEPLERDTLIALLSKLGSAEDEEVLAAARRLHSQVEASEATWDDLIVPEGAEEAEPEEAEPEDEDALDEAEEFLSEEPDEEERSPEERAAENAQALAVIEKLLAAPGHSAALKEELEGYKEDIAEGEFTSADYRYLRALATRLGK